MFVWKTIRWIKIKTHTMRIDVQFTDRVGIAQEILAALAVRALNVTAVEVEPPHVYIEAPELGARDLDRLRSDLLAVAGVQAVGELEILPGARRRLYLDALLASLVDRCWQSTRGLWSWSPTPPQSVPPAWTSRRWSAYRCRR